MGSPLLVDEGARTRLRSRYGHSIEPWLDKAPGVLCRLADRWGIRFTGPIPYGSMSVVVRCRTAHERDAILKLAPDVARLGREAEALATWPTPYVPEVYASDRSLGALLAEAIAPGTMLRDTRGYPAIAHLAALIGALHGARPQPGAFPPLATLIEYLYMSWDRHRRLHPELVGLVPQGLFERGRRFAERLEAQPSATVLLHCDLTPVNVLDGGERGLVAIDPSPCMGDPAYDTLDLLAWQANDIGTIEARAAVLAPAIGVTIDRIFDWLAAFGAMFALDLAGVGNWRGRAEADTWRELAAPFLTLARQAPGG